MTFEEWLHLGTKNGWITEPFCYTHDMVPITEAENIEITEDHDPCIHAVRLVSDEDRDELTSRNRS